MQYSVNFGFIAANDFFKGFYSLCSKEDAVAERVPRAFTLRPPELVLREIRTDKADDSHLVDEGIVFKAVDMPRGAFLILMSTDKCALFNLI